ncbi:MAG: hypothetical protein FJW68_01640 [Actinobacteria bacterium]|nr:hypothetical protein [Actinomycetota bacterium]
MRKPFEGLSGHGSSTRRRAKPENRAGFSSPGKRLRVFKIPVPAIRIILYYYHGVLDANNYNNLV